jgi:GNAT superfamily N-acetyltransferase
MVFEANPSPQLEQFIRNGVDNHNIALLDEPEYFQACFWLRGDHGEVLGGVLGAGWAGGFTVQFLWVARELRGKGHGAALLGAAEEHARARGCTSVLLDTHSFQAPRFYEKQGYVCVGEARDFPPGHSRLFFQKRLEPVR